MLLKKCLNNVLEGWDLFLFNLYPDLMKLDLLFGEVEVQS